MTPEHAIAALDRQLKAHGQTVMLRRYTGTGNPRPKTDLADVPAFVRAVKADDLVGDIKQTSSKVILSPTDIMTLWPLKTGDKVVFDGVEREVEAVKPIKLANTLVRCELVVAG
jgi:hypothetical protein